MILFLIRVAITVDIEDNVIEIHLVYKTEF